MFYKIMFKRLLLSAAFLSLSSVAVAGNGVGNAVSPTELLIKFDISGSPSMANPGAFTIGGPGYASITTSSGAVLDNKNPGLQIATLEGAEIQLLGAPTDPVVNFTCLSNSCRISLKDGSVLTSDPDNLPLQGRLANIYGTMDNNEGHIPVRILGCGGLNGIAGPMQGWVGSICFNGTFNVEGLQLGQLTGGSNCTITMHDPKPFPMP